MLILGEISGIQTFVYDVSHQHGGQARRLRARSFYVQALSEAAAIRTLQRFSELGWKFDLSEHLRISAAGRFLLRGPAVTGAETHLRTLEAELSRWLLDHLSGELRVSLAVAPEQGTEVQQFDRLRKLELDESRLRPWAPLATHNRRWQPEALILPPLDTPCVICRRRPGLVTELDRDSQEQRLVCRPCHQQLELGRDLPKAKWLAFAKTPHRDEVTAFGLAVRVVNQNAITFDDDLLAVANLQNPEDAPGTIPSGRLLHRRLARSTPVDNKGQAATFEEIAARSTGAPYLGVLKADGDGLGAYLDHMFRGSTDLSAYEQLSGDLEEFSAHRLDQFLRREYRHVYTIYSGGDDLLLIGPWSEMFRVADEARRIFHEQVRNRPLTLSAGLAIISRRWPIRRAVAAADEQLELAKTSTINGRPKDQFAALGQVWKWSDHQQVMKAAWQLTDWVTARVCERGWLQTLLDLVEAAREPRSESASVRERRRGPLAESRWNYFVTRNVTRPFQQPLKHWLDDIGSELAAPASVEARYLPAIIRFAMLATRSSSDRE